MPRKKIILWTISVESQATFEVAVLLSCEQSVRPSDPEEYLATTPSSYTMSTERRTVIVMLFLVKCISAFVQVQSTLFTMLILPGKGLLSLLPKTASLSKWKAPMVRIADYLPDGFESPSALNGKSNKPKKPKDPIKVNTMIELRRLIKQGYRVADLDVRGNTSIDPNRINDIHPVVKALYERKDGNKIAVAIEGGKRSKNHQQFMRSFDIHANVRRNEGMRSCWNDIGIS